MKIKLYNFFDRPLIAFPLCVFMTVTFFVVAFYLFNLKEKRQQQGKPEIKISSLFHVEVSGNTLTNK